MGWWNPTRPSAPTEHASPSAGLTSVTPPDTSSNSASSLSPRKPAQNEAPAERLHDLFEGISEGRSPESTDTSLRYAAYTNRIRTILSSAHRYVAYTSDIGESFRPVAHPGLVRAAYGISWAYILGDVSYEGYKAYLQNQSKLFPKTQSEPWRDGSAALGTSSPGSGGEARGIPPLEDYRTVMAQRGIFQALASMGLPAFTIHSTVKYTGKAMKNVKNQRLRTWGPIGLGLGIVPFLPSLFDEPVENAVEWAFHEGFKWYGGKDYVGNTPATGRERALDKAVEKEKRL